MHVQMNDNELKSLAIFVNLLQCNMAMQDNMWHVWQCTRTAINGNVLCIVYNMAKR